MKKAAALTLLAIMLAALMPFASALFKPSFFSEEKYCVDTDSFKTSPEFSRGYAQDSTGYYWDECTDDNSLVEMECSSGIAVQKLVSCEKGCFNGACIRYSFFKLPTFRLPIQSRLEALKIQPFTLGLGRSTGEETTEFKLVVMEARLDAMQNAMKSLYPELELKPSASAGVSELVFPLALKVTGIDGSINSGVIEDVFYVKVWAEGGNAKVEKVDYTNADIELMAEKKPFESLKEIAGEDSPDLSYAESIAGEAVDSGSARLEAYTPKGELAKKLELIRLRA